MGSSGVPVPSAKVEGGGGGKSNYLFGLKRGLLPHCRFLHSQIGYK